MNNKVETFPSNLIAGMGGFTQGEFFKVDGVQVRAAPKAAF